MSPEDVSWVYVSMPLSQLKEESIAKLPYEYAGHVSMPLSQLKEESVQWYGEFLKKRLNAAFAAKGRIKKKKNGK